jgi:hypothetical protein
MKMNLEGKLKWLRENGWRVGTHNDYHLRDDPPTVWHTFWLFTHPESGRFLKGEGLTDDDAVCQVYVAAYGIYLEKH